MFPLPPESSLAVRSGHLVVAGGRYAQHDGSYLPLTEFEWSHKDIRNLYCGVRRHLSAATTPTESGEFDRFTDAYFDWLFAKIKLPEPESFKLYPPRAFKDDPVKMRKYQTLIPEALRTQTLEKGPYLSFTKSGEVYTTSQPQYDGEFLIDDSRPRDIKSPQGIGFAVHAAVQSQLFPAIREADPSFIQAMSTDEICEAF